MEKYRLTVEKSVDARPYCECNMSVEEYQQYAYHAPRDLVGAEWREVKTQKKVTIPPEIWDCKTMYVTTTYFSTDEYFVIPLSYLGESILEARQHRELIGVIE